MMILGAELMGLVLPADTESANLYIALQGAINAAAAKLKIAKEPIKEDGKIGDGTFNRAAEVAAASQRNISKFPEVERFLGDFVAYLKSAPVQPITDFYLSIAKTGKSSNTLYWVLGGAGVLALGGGYYYMRRRRRAPVSL